MPVCQNRHHVGADLVGGVTVGGDTIGPHHHDIDLLLSHQAADGIIGDQRNRNAGTTQFIGGEAAALEKRSGFTGVDLD